MKRKYTYLLLCTILCTQFLSAQDYYWPLSTNLNELIAGKNGTNHGVTFLNDVVRGSVATFDGNSYCKLPSFIKDNAEITVAIWWRMDEIRPWSRIYSFGRGDQSEPKDVMMVIPINGAAPPVQGFYRFTLTHPTSKWLDADVDPQDFGIEINQWNYSVVVVKTDSVIFYHNDNKIFAGSFSRNLQNMNDIENALGKSFWPDQMWKGALSDLRVYKSALSEYDVISLYHETKLEPNATQTIKSASDPDISVSNNQIKVILKQSNENAMVSVYGIAGELICRKSISELNNTYISNGMYIVEVKNNQRQYTQKLVVR